MPVLARPWGHIYYRDQGPGGGLPILLMNSLGTDLRMWEQVVQLLPDLRIITCDKRGHGLSATPLIPWTMSDLASDALALLDHLKIDRALIGGCSIGGMIAQVIGASSPERAAGLFLTGSSPKAGTPSGWQMRIDAIRSGGMAAVAKWVVDHWFAPAFLASAEAEPWSRMVLRNDPLGYMAICKVLSETDLTAQTATIRVPVLLVSGALDPYNPPEAVRATAATITGARVEIVPDASHILPVENPARTAELLRDFHAGLAV